MKKHLQGNLKKLISIGLLVAGVSIASGMLSTVISHPTEQHRTVARQLNEEATKLLNGRQQTEAETKQFDELNQSAEGKYSMNASAITGMISFAIYIYLVFFTYGRIRKNRLAGANARGATVVTVLAATAISAVLQLAFDRLYLGSYPFPTTAGLLLLNTILAVFFIGGLTLVLTILAENRYNRKHSFIVE